jgi:hypothetical protein
MESALPLDTCTGGQTDGTTWTDAHWSQIASRSSEYNIKKKKFRANVLSLSETRTKPLWMKYVHAFSLCHFYLEHKTI